MLYFCLQEVHDQVIQAYGRIKKVKPEPQQRFSLVIMSVFELLD